MSKVKILQTKGYEKHGCRIYGNLLIFDYYEAMRSISAGEPLEGWGQGKCFDFIELIEIILKVNELSGIKCLSMPDYVFQLSDPNLVIKNLALPPGWDWEQ